jgi:hypothetical protein
MSEQLSYPQELSIIDQLIETLSSDPGATEPEDTAREVADSWLPIHRSDIREQWLEAGCPEPEDMMPDNNDEGQLNIHNLMLLGLAELVHSFATGAVWHEDIGSPTTNAEALEAIRADYPQAFTTA